MIDRKHRNLLQAEMAMPLNREAKRLLKEAKQVPEPDVLPALQLMLWGLDEGIKFPSKAQTNLFRTGLETLTYERSPKAAMEYLIKDDLGEVTLRAEHLQSKTPMEAAQEMIEVLDLKMKADPNLPYPK